LAPIKQDQGSIETLELPGSSKVPQLRLLIKRSFKKLDNNKPGTEGTESKSILICLEISADQIS
ncbi:MAG: hypothetical protein AB1711_12540, partial [Thermodesulfobacteriota bacterium]